MFGNQGKQRVSRGAARFLLTIAIGGGAAMALAQTEPATINSATQLGLPADFTVFGERDPNIRKPTAIVNGEIITRTDVDHRLALVIASNPDAEISDEERMRLRMQVLRNLIDETLQIQEARANEIEVADSDVDAAFQQIAERSGTTPDDFERFLREQGTSTRSMKRQIEGELAWQRLLGRNVNPYVNVSDAEVEAILDRMEEARGETEYRVSEIYLSATPATEDEVRANAERILEQLAQGASFPAYARQFSEASTAAVGGDLGWIRPAQLPVELAQAIPQIPVGSVSRPIPVAGGFSIIAVVDQRRILTTDPRDAVLSLKQITITFPAGAARESVEPRVEALANATRQGGGCGAAEGIAAQLGGDVVQNDEVRLGDLPPALQQAMAELQVGQASPPFGSIDEGVRVLVLCGRDAPPANTEPDAEVILTQLENERVNRQARRYLTDLRRDAVIEYR